MLNFEKRLKELNKEKAQIEAKKQEICERFDSIIAKKQEDIDKLENYKKDIGNLTKKQIDILSSANKLAGEPTDYQEDSAPEQVSDYEDSPKTLKTEEEHEDLYPEKPQAQKNKIRIKL